MTRSKGITLDKIYARAYRFPTPEPEADGSFQWNSSTMVLVNLEAGSEKGLGYTYADEAAAGIINNLLAESLTGRDCMDIPSLHYLMQSRIRNNGITGLAMMALSAVDIALWDLKAKLLGIPLCQLLGSFRSSIPVYGSGGFTSYGHKELQQQLSEWALEGMSAVKMKIGSNANDDPLRIQLAREAIGPDKALFVDANGAFEARQALALSEVISQYRVSWFEEPVSSDNLAGLRFVREKMMAPVRVAAGEYGFNLFYFRQMLDAGAVDVLQADATRCGGITGYLEAGLLAKAAGLPISFHCAPSIHLAAALSQSNFFIGEYFIDHVRIESKFFDGFPRHHKGNMYADPSRPGLGIQFREGAAAAFQL